MRKKRVLLVSMILLVSLAFVFSVFAHSGRTDSNGGHRDNNNSSGLGSYHYHCGGYPAHLHKNGYCPYTSYSSSGYTGSSDDYDEGYDAGYEDGYYEGQRTGYDEGYDDGHYEGHNDGYNDGYQARIEEVAAERKKQYTFLLISILVIVVIVLVVKFIKRYRKE